MIFVHLASQVRTDSQSVIRTCKHYIAKFTVKTIQTKNIIYFCFNPNNKEYIYIPGQSQLKQETQKRALIHTPNIGGMRILIKA